MRKLDEKPTIPAIFPERPLFDFNRQAAQKSRFPLGLQPLELFRGHGAMALRVAIDRHPEHCPDDPKHAFAEMWSFYPS